ncbi:UNVERIFIED_CONTAM: hypothetical protein FKN15_066342 [Acipenser sinensis]
MAPRPQNLPAFPDFMEEVRSSWDRPDSGPSMLASLIVAHRQLWLSQARVPDADNVALLDAPLSPGHTFGPAVEEILQRSHR